VNYNIACVAHRGGDRNKENTIEAVLESIKKGFKYIEIDIQESNDGELIVLHDINLFSKFNIDVIASTCDWSRLSLIRHGDNNQYRIPLLSEVCSIISHSDVTLILDIKSQGIEQRVIDMIETYNIQGKCILASFNHKSLKIIKNYNGSINTMALFECTPVNVTNFIADSSCNYIGVGYESLSIDVVIVSKKLGIPCFVWTVNNLKDIERAAIMGVDGIISDYPDRVRRLLDSTASQENVEHLEHG